MLLFAWWSLRGRWERVGTLCLGLLCISVCTTLLAGFTQLSSLTAQQQVSRAWHTPYDLLVRAPTSLSQPERQLSMIDPSGPEQTYGGISLRQVSVIAHISHVAVAAPEAIVGWVLLRPYVSIPVNQPGLYRITTELSQQATASVQSQKNSASTRVQHLVEVLPLPTYIRAANMQSNITYLPLNASGTAIIVADWSLPTLLAAIDPAAEARLTGLRWQPSSAKTPAGAGVPLLMDTHPWTALTASLTVERAALPASAMQKKDGALSVTPSWRIVTRQQLASRDLLAVLAHELDGQNASPDLSPQQGGGVTRYARTGYALFQSGNATNPLPVLKLLSPGADAGGLLTRLPLFPATTTPWIPFDRGGSFTTFDSAQLPVLSEENALAVPLGLYRPGPGSVSAGLFPQYSVISAPPLLLTTVSAACALTGTQCISAVRVRVANVGLFGPGSEALLQQVTADIETRTGLHVDILTGASGRQVEVQMPSNASISEIWIQPFAAVTIASGVNGTNVLLLLWAVGVAALALVAAALLSANSRRGNIAILGRIGWSGRQILTAAAAEAAVTALLAALPAWLASLLLQRLGVPAVSPALVLAFLACAMILYIMLDLLATRVLSMQTRKNRLRALSRWSLESKLWWIGMVRRQISWRRGSAALVVLATAGACGLVSILLLVFLGLDGILYSTLLGRQVQVSLSTIHIITAVLTCASATMTAGLTILLMVRERRRDFGVLLASGWRGRDIALEVVREGMVLGLLGGVCGGLAALCIFLAGYSAWEPLLLLASLPVAALLGMVLCVLGAIYPASLAARCSPKQVLVKA